MKRPLILHIGLSKTGSSSIQRLLADQRPALLAQGAYLPTSPGWANHALLAAAFVADRSILWGYHPATWEGMTQEARLDRLREEFEAEMASLTPDTTRVILTAEQFGGVLRQQAEVDSLAAYLSRYFDPIEIVVYIRRQDQHAASAYSEWLRGGLMVDPALPQGGPERRPEYDYGGLLDRWAASFGQAAMTPRIFARDRLAQGDVVADFLAIAGLTLPALEGHAKRESNPSLSVAGQTLLLAAGRRMAATAGGTIWRDTPAWRHLAEAINQAMPGSGWRPTQQEAREFLARFAGTNERARARFFPDQESLFDTNLANLPAKPAPPDPDQALNAALDALLHEVQASAHREALAAMAQYRLNRKLEDRPAMRASLLRALRFAPDMLAVRLRLAEWYLAEGDRRQAQEHAAAALRIAPEDPVARRLNL